MDLLINFLPLIVFGVAAYFLLFLPQKRRQDQRAKELSAIKKGDAVVTIGGLHAVIDEVDLAERTVVLDCEGVYLTFELNAIARVKQSVSTVTPDVSDETVAE